MRFAKKRCAAKAEAVDMAPGFALYSVSLPEKSNKRKHGYTIEEVARKDNDVSDHQDRRDNKPEVSQEERRGGVHRYVSACPRREGTLEDEGVCHELGSEEHRRWQAQQQEALCCVVSCKRISRQPASNSLCEIWPCRLSSRAPINTKPVVFALGASRRLPGC
jgi:hypothetical protein